MTWTAAQCERLIYDRPMMRTSVVVILMVCVLWGCKVNNPRYCDEVTQCGDPDRPYCDLTGQYPASGGVSNNCIACEPDAFLGCLGDTAGRCNADGSERLSEECSFGCNAAAGRCNECEPGAITCANDVVTACGADGLGVAESCPLGCHPDGARCYELEPSNDLRFYLEQAAQAPNVTLSDGATIDTDTGEILDGDGTAVLVDSVVLPEPEDGVPVRVFMVGRLTAGDLLVVGEPAIAILAHDEIVLTGDFSVSATSFGPGPGSIVPVFGMAAPPCVGLISGRVSNNQSGRGGGGNATPGGMGGAIVGERPGGAGGSATENASLIPLHGGCPGHVSQLSQVNGGGAVQLVSRVSILLDVDAHITANGAGGHAGDIDFLSPGGGGGSGGGILLEAPTVELRMGAGLLANGGAGGCAHFRGQDGQRSATPARGASCTDARYPPGGDGGSVTASPGPGGPLDYIPGEDGIAGSGGGAVGFIRINTLHGSYTMPAGQVVLSPIPFMGVVTLR